MPLTFFYSLSTINTLKGRVPYTANCSMLYCNISVVEVRNWAEAINLFLHIGRVRQVFTI